MKKVKTLVWAIVTGIIAGLSGLLGRNQAVGTKDFGPAPYRRASAEVPAAVWPGVAWLRRRGTGLSDFFSQRHVKIAWRFALVLSSVCLAIFGILTLLGVSIPNATFYLPLGGYALFSVSRWTDIPSVAVLTMLVVWLLFFMKERAEDVGFWWDDEPGEWCEIVITVGWMVSVVVGLVCGLVELVKGCFQPAQSGHLVPLHYLQHGELTVLFAMWVLYGALGVLFGGLLFFRRKEWQVGIGSHFYFVIWGALVINLMTYFPQGFVVGLLRAFAFFVIFAIGTLLGLLVVSSVVYVALNIKPAAVFLFKLSGGFGRWLIAAETTENKQPLRPETSTSSFVDHADSDDEDEDDEDEDDEDEDDEDEDDEDEDDDVLNCRC